MRILHVISSPASGGAEVYVKDLVLELKKQGYFVAIAFLNRAVDVGRCENFEKKFLAQLDSAFIPYFFIGYEARKKPWLGVMRVRKYVKENKINIYHSHLPYGVVFSFMSKIPCIYTHHNILPKMTRFQYFIFNKLISCYIGISKKCTEKLVEYSGRDVKTIQNGICLNKIKKKLDCIDNSSKVKAIAVGGLQAQKNYLYMIKAVSNLSSEALSRLQLYIAGEGPDKKEIEIFIKEKKLESVVTLIGNRSDIPDLLYKSDLFLMSSAWEGLPIALIEAAATGLPCLVTDVGGCSEVIDACENGYYIGLGSYNEYTEKLETLILNRKLRKQFTEKALLNSSRYSIVECAHKHIAVYNNFKN